MTRNLLDIDDVTAEELTEILDLAELADPPPVLAGLGVGLLFEKPSARTRSSSEMAVFQLGGRPVSIRGEEVGLDTRETAEDLARTMACYFSLLGARVMDHRSLERMATALGRAGARVPVVNLLSDRAHPCQALADLLTLRQSLGRLSGRTIAYVGDPNNVCVSLALAATMSGMAVRVACPARHPMDAGDESRISDHGALVLTEDPGAAVEGVDAIYTDVWTSMGQEAEAQARGSAFAGFTVDEQLVSRASPGAVVLHCLPAHRGEEIEAGVLEGRQSVVWRQAENRMHAMRGLLLWLRGGTREHTAGDVSAGAKGGAEE